MNRHLMRSLSVLNRRAVLARAAAGVAVGGAVGLGSGFDRAAAQGATSARTIRVFWSNASSGWRNFNWGGVIDEYSVVHISVSEATFSGEAALQGILHARGDAVIGVRNVAPHSDIGGGGGVEFFLEVGWDTPLDLVTDITVFPPPEQALVA